MDNSAATPSPISAPASIGFRRAQAEQRAGRESRCQRIEIREDLKDQYRRRRHQGRRSRDPPRAGQLGRGPHRRNARRQRQPNAAMLKNITTSAMIGTDTSLVSAV